LRRMARGGGDFRPPPLRKEDPKGSEEIGRPEERGASPNPETSAERASFIFFKAGFGIRSWGAGRLGFPRQKKGGSGKGSDQERK